MASKKTRCAIQKLTPYVKPTQNLILVALTLSAIIGNYYVYQDMQFIKYQINEEKK